MDKETWNRIKELTADLLDLPTSARERMLAGESDPVVRDEVGKLMAAHSAAGGFMDRLLPDDLGLRDTLNEGDVVDGYRIVGKIAEGGMGAVFLAERDGSGDRLALKVIKRGMDTDAVFRRFLIERQILAQLDHPMIARMIDGGSTASGLPYFVMEYVEGVSIRQFCDERDLSQNERLALFLKVCEAVAYAHKNLVVHRDLKPSNILVCPDGTPKLLDFGIAKLLAPNWNDATADATATMFRQMTPEYASPEQIRGRATTTATDIYSLGVVLYELLTGVRPFDFRGKSAIEIADEILMSDPPLPSASVATARAGGRTGKSRRASGHYDGRSLRGDVDNIVFRALRKEPDDRYGSVGEFADDIGRYLGGLPVRAAADSRRYRIRKFVGRHRAGVATAVAVTLLMIASAAVTTRQYVVAQRERATSDERLRQLRSLSKSLLAETNEALAKIPEGLEIRGRLIEKSVSVIDSLALEQTDDVELLTELADAYQTIGRYRNWNARDSGNPFDALEKALVLRRRVVELSPGRAESLKKLDATIDNLIDASNLNNDVPRAIGFLEMKSAALERRIELAPADPNLFMVLSETKEVLAARLSAAGRDAEAAARLRESVETADRSLALLTSGRNGERVDTEMMTALFQQASIRDRLKRADEALALYEQAAGLADRIYAADATQSTAFNSSVRIRRLMADIHRGRGDWRKALDLYEICLSRLEANRDNEALDRRNLAGGYPIYLMRKAIALDKLGERREASLAVESGLRYFRQFLDANRKDPETIIFAPETLEVAASFYLDRGDRRNAANVWQLCVDRLEPFLAASPGDAGFAGRIAGCLVSQGDATAGYSARERDFRGVSRNDAATALAHYEKALATSASAKVRSADAEAFETELKGRIAKLSAITTSGSR